MAKWTHAGVLKAAAAELRTNTYGNTWEGVDAITAISPDAALKLATALLEYYLTSKDVTDDRRPTRENILQAGREGWNPGNLAGFSHLERLSSRLFGQRFNAEWGKDLAPKTALALPGHTAKWTDEMLWVFLRSFASNSAALKKRRWVKPLLKHITPVDPEGHGGFLLNNLRGVKNPKKRAAARPVAVAKKTLPAVKLESNATLAALRKKPDDHATLAVFADWLTEQGDPTGELIHLELSLVDRPSDVALLAAKTAWLKTNPSPSPCLTLERRLGLPHTATFEFKTGKAEEHKALAAFLQRPEAKVLDTLNVNCGSVQVFKPVVDALERAKPLGVRVFELNGNGSLEAGTLFTSTTFPSLERLELTPNKFRTPPVIALPTLVELVVGVTQHNGPLSLQLARTPTLRSLGCSTAYFEPGFLGEVLRGKWPVTRLGLFAWRQPELWEQLQAAPIFKSLKAVGASWQTPPRAPPGKELLTDPF